MKKSFYLLAAAMVLMFACSEKSGPVTKPQSIAVESVTVNPDSWEMTVGETKQLEAVIAPPNATEKTVTWSSSDEDVAKVSPSGEVSALKAGTATISATAGEKSGNCQITVKPVTPQGLSVTQALQAPDGPVTIADAIVAATGFANYHLVFTDGVSNICGQAYNIGLSVGDKVNITANKSSDKGIPSLSYISREIISHRNPVPHTELTDITDSFGSYSTTKSDYVIVKVVFLSLWDEGEPCVAVSSSERSLSAASIPESTISYKEGMEAIFTGYISSVSKTQVEIVAESLKPVIPVPESVDLGLPSGTQWASFNLGATKSYEPGWYFAWGELLPKYDYENYTGPYWDASEELAPEDDAARFLLGGNWRMPSMDQMEELRTKCTWTYDNTGYTVTGPNGSSILLPWSGYTDSLSPLGINEKTLNLNSRSKKDGFVYYMGIDTGEHRWSPDYDFILHKNVAPATGMAVRAVLEPIR